MDKYNLAEIFLTELGFYPQHSGFGYLAGSIAGIASDPESYYSGKTCIMSIVSDKYGVSAICARRCMNYAIRCAWYTSNNELFHKMFENTSGFPPTLHEFICRSAVELNGALNGIRPDLRIGIQPAGRISDKP